MDSEFSIKPGDSATNSLMAEIVTRLSEAEEARFRELLAEAWDDGLGRTRWLFPQNPYRLDPADEFQDSED